MWRDAEQPLGDASSEQRPVPGSKLVRKRELCVALELPRDRSTRALGIRLLQTLAVASQAGELRIGSVHQCVDSSALFRREAEVDTSQGHAA